MFFASGKPETKKRPSEEGQMSANLNYMNLEKIFSVTL